MDAEKLISVFTDVGSVLNKLGFVPQEMPEELKGLYSDEVPDEVILSHIAYMCEGAIEFVNEGRVEKAMHWLGFVQSACYFVGFYSIDELKEQSRPAEQPPANQESWPFEEESKKTIIQRA